ncbi:MAG: ATP-dependent helicase, partial [Candidatus Obscuribacterales bacterium]
SLLVVGDVDQSIYSWRKADYRIFLGFQGDYKGARLIKLEDNYSSTSTILDIANSNIENNTERIEKDLRCNKGRCGKAQYYDGVDEIDEAFYVVEELKRLKARGRNLNDCVILYRTNAQSRSIEEVLIRNDIPYKVVGGTRFYDRQEIKDMVAYLKLVFNPRDGIAFNRVVNTPKRGLGKTTLDRVADYAGSRGISTIEAARDAQFIGNLSARAVSALKEFAYQVLERWQSQAHKKERNAVSGLIELILSDTKYMEMLEEQAISNKDELAYGRIENVREFLAVAKEFEEIADEPDLDSFLTRISLVSDLDQVELEDEAIKLMTLHSAKGLEFPVVFMIGLEDGLFPHSRSFDEPTAMEEERRLMYVGVTRAEDLLYVTRARKRTMLSRGGPNASGFQTSATIASRFLSEITPGLLTGYYPQEKQERESSRQFEDFGWSSGGPESYEDSDQGSYGGGSGSRGRSSGNYGRGSGNYGNSYGNTYSQGSNSRTGSSSRTGSGSGSSSSSRPGSGSSRPSSPSRSSSPSRPSSPARPGTPRPRLAMRPGDVSSSQISSGSKSESQEAEPAFERLSVGDTVQHAKFGTGKVEAVLGEGSKELYNIDFGESGKRLMDPRFAKLIKLP